MGFSPQLIHTVAGDEANFFIDLEKVVDLGKNKGRNTLFHLNKWKIKKEEIYEHRIKEQIWDKLVAQWVWCSVLLMFITS